MDMEIILQAKSTTHIEGSLNRGEVSLWVTIRCKARGVVIWKNVPARIEKMFYPWQYMGLALIREAYNPESGVIWSRSN